MLTSWQKKRSSFNHDWLKNGYILRLSEWLNLLDDKIEDPELENSFVDKVLTTWELQRSEAMSLPIDFKKEMSPTVLFNDLPLSNCDDETKTWLGDIIHNLWLVRYSVNELTSTVIKCANDTDAAYQSLQKALKGCKDTKYIETLRSYRGFFADLLDKCRFLAAAIEKLPNEVKAV